MDMNELKHFTGFVSSEYFKALYTKFDSSTEIVRQVDLALSKLREQYGDSTDSVRKWKETVDLSLRMLPCIELVGGKSKLL